LAFGIRLAAKENLEPRLLLWVAYIYCI